MLRRLLRRLTVAVGAPLFVRQGRGLAITSRGRRLLASVEPHLRALVDAALSPGEFEPGTTTRTVRLGLADAAEQWLLPPLVRRFQKDAPSLRLIVLPVQFRTVGAALASGSVDIAVTVADELPAAVLRRSLLHGGFVCLFDPRHARLPRKLTEKAYFAHEHIIVSYNGDLRGVVEDTFHKTRRVRCSIASFASLGAILEGTSLLATVPALVAHQIRMVRPHLRTTALPFRFEGSSTEMLWPAATDDDGACRFVRDAIVQATAASAKSGALGRITGGGR